MDKAPQTALALLAFEQRIRACESDGEVLFCAVNETLGLLRFDQAVVWRETAFGSPAIAAASGLADIGSDSPYQQWLTRLISSVAAAPLVQARAIAFADLPAELAVDGHEWGAQQMLLLPLRGPEGEPFGGLLFMRAEPFSESEVATAQWLAQAVGYAAWAWHRRRTWRGSWRDSRRQVRRGLIFASLIVLAGFLPVRLTALAPAEITPLKPTPVTSPIDGVVREILVQPNQDVKAGDAVALLDDTDLRNRLSLAEKALDIARAELQRATYKSFTDELSRLELQVLDARVREKAAEVNHFSEVLGRLTLLAPQAGVAVFADPEQWRGKPVQVGERVMLIADPRHIDVTIYLAPDDAVELEPGAEVAVFLNVDPLVSLQAEIERSSYEALPAPDGELAYLVRANLLPGHEFPRIGLRGTAKVYAGSVSLAYYLFRKPLAYLRRTIGI